MSVQRSASHMKPGSKTIVRIGGKGAQIMEMRKESDAMGEILVPADRLWGAQTQRSIEHFSIGKDLMPREMITAYATLKKAAAIANRDGKRLDEQRCDLIVQTC